MAHPHDGEAMSHIELRRLTRVAQSDPTSISSLACIGRAYLRHVDASIPAFRIGFRRLGKNQTELETREHRILFSFEAPVAAYVKASGLALRTSEDSDGARWSQVTIKHINAWMSALNPQAIEKATADDIARLLDT